MKRYKIFFGPDSDVYEEPAGKWVKWEDVEQWMLQLYKEIEDDEKWWNPEESWALKITKESVEKALGYEPTED